MIRSKKSSHRKPAAGRHKWHYILAGVALLLVALLAAGLWRVSRHIIPPKVSVTREEYPIQGIDVSNHNGPIDFARVAAGGVTFVYVKASEGSSYRDPRFTANVDAAHRAGLTVGAYHFFRKDKPGHEQARNFIEVTRHVQLEMPLVIDVEDWGNSHFSRHREVIRNLTDMINALQSLDYRLMIYTNKSGYNKYLLRHFPNMPLWLCAFAHPSQVAKSYRCIIHQYSHWGSVDGIEGEVDLNVFCGDSTAWHRWLTE